MRRSVVNSWGFVYDMYFLIFFFHFISYNRLFLSGDCLLLVIV